MESNETNKRCRMNVSITAKGLAQWDITCEYETPELSSENLGKAIGMVREVIKSKGLAEAGSE